MRRLAHLAIVAGLAFGWLALIANAASAHANLDTSVPAANSTLHNAPSQVTATFTEAPDPQLSYLHVLDSTGHQVDTARTQAVPGKPLELRLPLPSLPDGTYTVTWRTVSKVDGHVVGNSFAFGVGQAPAAPAGGAAVKAVAPSPSVLSVVGKWGLYAGVSVLFAAGAVSLIVFGGVVPGGRRTVLIAWVVLAAGYAAMLVAERSTLGIALGTLLGSEAGRPLVDLGIAIGIALLPVILVALRPARWSLLLLAAGAAFVMLERVLGGHAAATQSFRWFNVADQWIHILAVATWIGGLVLLFLHVVRNGGGAEVRRFSTLAGFALAAVAVSGVFRAVDELGGWSAWLHVLDSSFGVTLALKIALFLVLVALGAWNRYVNVPRATTTAVPAPDAPRTAAPAPIAGGSAEAGNGRGRMRPLRAVVTAELVVAAGIFGLTGVLTGLPPAATITPAQAAAPANLSVTGHDFATSVKVRLTATPGLVGSNRYRADVVDYDTGAPVAASAVSLAFTLPSDPSVSSNLDLHQDGTGVWTGSGAQLSIQGSWEVTVTVTKATTSVDVPLKLTPRTPPQQLSVTPGTPPIYTVTFPNGDQIQSYVDPGTAGLNQVHITAFDAKGDELGLRSATAQAAGTAGTKDLKTKRFDEPTVPKNQRGHFVANTQLTQGSWTVTITATALDGTLLQAHYTTTVGAAG
ncbi:MAG: copper resistance CopC/CopD family protein [Actinomycetota bacterium]